MGLALRSILCVPLKIKNRILGVIYVDNRMQTGIFVQADLELLDAIAANAAIAIENARLYQVTVEKGRLEREHQMAHEVQASLLPHQIPQIPGWEFVARWRPAREVAGDYYDFLPLGKGRLGLVIADVSGKGMPAALFMAVTRSIIRTSVFDMRSPKKGIERANLLICADATGGMFVTLFYAQLNPEIGEVTYVNAGHNPPLVCEHGASIGQVELTELTRTGMALGVLPDDPLDQRTLHLGPGGFIFLYTDGVVDATNSQGRMFGKERLKNILVENGHKAAMTIVTALENEIDSFTGSAAQFDDIAILIAKRL
jgi:sigma-B regulation protein RsbU (phosphoserine phosphatase)